MIFANNPIIDFVNQLPGIVCIKDLNSKILACSPTLANLIGYAKPEQVQGITDFDMRCDAVNGAEAFIRQDKDALARGENIAINVHTYRNGEKIISYSEKAPLIINNEIIGINAVGHDLTYLSNVANRFYALLDADGTYLNINQKKAATYTLYDTYPNLNLSSKESLCLFFILRGKTNKEIAYLLNLSVRTIEDKVVEIKHKLNCNSRKQIIERAIHKEWLHIIIKEIFKLNNFSLTINS